MDGKTILDKIWKVIKTIFLVITSPIWFPWKVLFKNNGKQENVAIKSVKNVLKFVVFVVIILIEVLVVHKVRYSPLTYPFTKNSVRNYYLNETRLVGDGLEETYKTDFEKMLGFIDEWELDEKNKMNNILNSDFMKSCLKYTDNGTIYYIINKFNTDETFRNDVKKFVKDIDKSITRFIDEIPENDFVRLNNFLSPIITISSWAIDYGGALDIGGAVFNWAVDKYSIAEKSLYVNSSNVEKGIKTGLDFSNGVSLETVTGYWK